MNTPVRSNQVTQQDAGQTSTAITVDPSTEVGKRMAAWLAAVPLFIDNGYTTRALYYGVASACGRQIDYIEDRLQSANAGRLRSLLNTATAKGNGTAAEVGGEDEGSQESVHSIQDQIVEVQLRIEQNEQSIDELHMLQRLAIENHDEVSLTLNLPVWGTIQAGGINKATANNKLVTPEVSAVLDRLDKKRENRQAARARIG